MKYDFVAIPDEEVPKAANPLFQHLVTTYASETNKTVSTWRAVADADALLRRAGTATDLDVLAAGASHLSPPDPSADVAPPGRSTRPGNLGPVRSSTAILVRTASGGNSLISNPGRSNSRQTICCFGRWSLPCSSRPLTNKLWDRLSLCDRYMTRSLWRAVLLRSANR